MEDVLHEVYLPFTEAELHKHFAPVSAAQDGRHLEYYRKSMAHLAAYRAASPSAKAKLLKRGRQHEKDERFWIVTGLMGIFHASDDPAVRLGLISALLERARLSPPGDFTSWEAALAGELHLFFEVNLPAPVGYKAWLRDHVEERSFVPYVSETAGTGKALEGATKADAMLLSSTTGAAVIFEAKVLSDVSTQISYDAARNQLARLIDVMLEQPKDRPPLSARKPSLTTLVLVTPDLFRNAEAKATEGSRLYSWLLPRYRDPADGLLGQHLGHRHSDELRDVPGRLGWLAWEDFNLVAPGTCGWLGSGSAAT